MKIKKLLSKIMAVVMLLSIIYVPSNAFASNDFSLTITEDAFSIKEEIDINIKNKVKGSKYTWISSNEKVATVNKVGVVKGLKAGDVTITCAITTPDGETHEFTSDITINSKTKITVVNQKQLEEALANEDVEQIIIKTSKEKEFVIPEGKYDKRLYMKAPEAEIINEGDFKSVHTYVSNQEQLDKALADEKVTIVTIVTDEEENFELVGDYSRIRVIINAPEATVVNNAILRKVDIKKVNELEEKVYVPEVEDEEPEVTPVPEEEELPPVIIGGGGGFGGGGSVPSNPDPVVPSVPSNPGSGDTGTGSGDTGSGDTGSGTEDTVVDDIRLEYLSKLNDIIESSIWKKMSISTYKTDFMVLVQEKINSITNATTKETILNEFKLVEERVAEYEIKDDLFTDVIAPDENGKYNLPSDVTINKDDNGYYEFTTTSGRYYVVREDLSYINNATFASPKWVDESVTSVTGSAIQVDIVAWNNVEGFEGITEITRQKLKNMEFETEGDKEKLEIGEHYDFINKDPNNSSSRDSILIYKVDTGLYTYHVSFEVPYLGITNGHYTGNDNSVSITLLDE